MVVSPSIPKSTLCMGLAWEAGLAQANTCTTHRFTHLSQRGRALPLPCVTAPGCKLTCAQPAGPWRRSRNAPVTVQPSMTRSSDCGGKVSGYCASQGAARSRTALALCSTSWPSVRPKAAIGNSPWPCNVCNASSALSACNKLWPSLYWAKPSNSKGSSSGAAASGWAMRTAKRWRQYTSTGCRKNACKS